MNITEDNSSATYKINRYEPGKIWVNQQCYSNSIIISSHYLQPLWRPQSMDDLQIADFDYIFEQKPAILLLGTGETLSIPNEAIMNKLFAHGIGVEFMDTRAACHTFTVLASEERNIIACLLC